MKLVRGIGFSLPPTLLPQIAFQKKNKSIDIIYNKAGIYDPEELPPPPPNTTLVISISENTVLTQISCGINTDNTS